MLHTELRETAGGTEIATSIKKSPTCFLHSFTPEDAFEDDCSGKISLPLSPSIGEFALTCCHKGISSTKIRQTININHFKAGVLFLEN